MTMYIALVTGGNMWQYDIMCGNRGLMWQHWINMQDHIYCINNRGNMWQYDTMCGNSGLMWQHWIKMCQLEQYA